MTRSERFARRGAIVADLACPKQPVVSDEIVYLEAMERRRGHYLGTEIDGSWHRRYRKDRLFARGLGDYWFENGELCFRRYLNRTPFRIPLRAVRSIETGSWHAGRWAVGNRVIKLVWAKDGKSLSSGFVFTRTAEEAMHEVEALQRRVASLRNDPTSTERRRR